MQDSHEFLKALTIVLGVAAVVTIVFQRLKQPVVLGYIIAGLIIGPHVPVPLVANRAVVQTLSELGVILLMFSLGLEFSIRKLIQVGPTVGVTAMVQSSLMVWLGYSVGGALGFSSIESLFAGGILAISSTTIIAKVFDEQNIRGPLRDFVVGVLIVEDLIAILLMAALTAIASGSKLSASALAVTIGRLSAFLVILVVLGLLIVPRLMRAVVRLRRPETTLIATIALCFGISLLAHGMGYSVALGAFIAGSLVSESGEEKTIGTLIAPVRDMFAAIFFVSVGLLIDPALIVRHFGAVATLTGLVIGGKILGVSLGAFLTGHGVRTSVQAGMSLAQIGEFSFIIASLGLTLGATREFLYSVAVTVSAVTTLTTPWLIRFSGRVAGFVDRKIPRSLQTFASLYATWIEGLKKAPRQQTRGAAVRRLVKLLLVDAFFLAAIAIGASVSFQWIWENLGRRIAIRADILRWLLVVVWVSLTLPFVAGLARVARKLAMLLAEAEFPGAMGDRTDLAAAPRRMLVATLQLMIVLLVGIPLVAVTQPFLPGSHAAVAFWLILIAMVVSFWRSARNFEGHVQAGAQMVAEALDAHSAARRPTTERMLEEVHQLLPGFGAPVSLTLEAASPAVGRSLAQLNLRGLTGVTVLAIHRTDKDVLVPRANEVLREGDILALAGTEEALVVAKQLLIGDRV